jgi:hypothetical protein
MIPANSSVPTISGAAQVGQTLTATTGTWTHNPTSYSYQWDTSKPVFSSALPTSNNNYQGYQSRAVLASAKLTNPGITSGLIRVMFSIAAGTSNGTLNGAYIGELGSGNAVSFNGSQVQLTFGGATSLTGLGSGTVISDFIPFTLNTSTSLVISSLWGVGQVNASNATGSTNNTTYYSNTVTDPSATTPSFPTGWGTLANELDFVLEIEFAPIAISGAVASAYVPVTGDIGNSLMVSVVATNSGGSSSPATSATTSAVTAASGGVLDFSQASNSGLISAFAA